MKAMLLAAGEGTRFRPQTLKVPKPALPLLNVPLGYYFFPFLKSVGVDTLTVNTYHLPDLIEKLYKEQNHLKAHFSHETGKILGSGGGLGKARDYFKGEENFFLLNADEVLVPHNPNFLNEMKAQHLKNKPISTLLVMKHPGVGTRFGGIWVDAKKNIVGYGKVRPTNAVEGFHFPGIQLLNNKVFDFIPEGIEQNILYDTLSAAQKAGHKVEIFEITSHWYETGSLSDYLAATKDILNHLAIGTKEFESLRKFYSEFTPQSKLEKTADALIWKDQTAVIESTQIHGFGVVGANCRLINSTLNDAVISFGVHTQRGDFKSDLVL